MLDFAGGVCRHRLPKTCDNATLPLWEDAPLAGSQLQPITVIPNRAGISYLNKRPPSLSWLCSLSCSHTVHLDIHRCISHGRGIFAVYLCNIWNPKSSTGISAPSCYNPDSRDRASSQAVSTQQVLSMPGHSIPLQVPVTPYPKGGLLAHPLGLSLWCHLLATPASPRPHRAPGLGKVQADPRTPVLCSPPISSTSLAIEIPCQGVSSVLFLALLLGFLDQTIDFLGFCVVFFTFHLLG